MLLHPLQPKKLNLKSDHTEFEIRPNGISLKASSPTMAMGNGGRANKQTSKLTSKQPKKYKSGYLSFAMSPVFFLVRCSGCSHCVGPSVACFSRIVGLSCKKKLQLINRNRPCTTNSEASPGLRKWLLGLADLSEGCMHLI